MAISIKALSRRFQSFQALDRVSLEIADGEFVALLGPSGSGKTTLLRILAGLDDPDSGEVWRDGEDLLRIDPRHRHVGLVFQHYALFAHMRVGDNVAFGLRVRPRRQRPPRAEIQRRVEELLRKVQLQDLAQRYPAQLSGGQRQRVALARALAIEPSLLLLDEPFGALDAQVRVNLRQWLRQLHDELGITTVFVTHDQEEALELADRVVVMNQGRIEQVGSPAMIYAEPQTPFVYEFIGRRGQLPATRDGTRVRVLESLFEPLQPLPADWREGEVYLRPEQCLSASPEAAQWSARILAVQPAGAAWRLRLAVGEREWPLDAEWPRDGMTVAPLVGERVGLRVQTLSLFIDADGDRRAYRLRPASA